MPKFISWATLEGAARNIALAACCLVMLGRIQPLDAAELETIKPGTLVVAFNGDMPGTSWENDKLIGVDGEIVQWIADELHLKIEPAVMEFSAEIGSVQTKRADIMLGMVSWRPQRAEVLNMSDPLYYAQALFVQKKGQNWSHIKDLEGKSVASIQGFGQAKELREMKGVDLHLYDTSDAAIRDLLAGRVHVLFADPPLIAYALKRNTDWDIHAVPSSPEYDAKYPTLSGTKYEVVIGMSKDAPNLTEAFNRKIREAWATCRIHKAAEKYGLDGAAWFDPGDRDPRAGVDRSKDWQPPILNSACK
jgi:polar amino acid transport system substrate-binding protein